MRRGSPPRVRVSPANRADNRLHGLISGLIDAGEVPAACNSSQVLRLGTHTLTNARSDLNARGSMLERIVSERGLDPSTYSTDPFLRGTQVRGSYNVAHRLSGKSVRVSRMTPDGTLEVMRQGEGYYKHNRNEFIVHLPVWINYPDFEDGEPGQRRSHRSYQTDPVTRERITVPLTDAALLAQARFTNISSMSQSRARFATVDEQKTFLKEAVVRYLENHDAPLDEFGRIPLQDYTGSDKYYSFDPETLPASIFRLTC